MYSKSFILLIPPSSGESNKYEPVAISQRIQAIDHMSALNSQSFRPRITSGARYCRVWIRPVKWSDMGWALPKSTSLMLNWGGLADPDRVGLTFERSVPGVR